MLCSARSGVVDVAKRWLQRRADVAVDAVIASVALFAFAMLLDGLVALHPVVIAGMAGLVYLGLQKK